MFLAKPAPWNINPAYTSPEWAWAWRRPPVFLAPMWDLSARDYSQRRMSVASNGNPVLVPSQYGRAIQYDGTNTYHVVTDSGGTLDAMTLMVLFKINTYVNFGALAWQGSSSGWRLQLRNDAASMEWNPPTVNRPVNGGSVNDGGWHTAIGVYDLYEINSTPLYVDGAIVSGGSGTHSGTAFELDDWGIGATTGGAQDFNGEIAIEVVWPFAVTAAQAKQLADDPFGFIRPDTRIVVKSAGATAFSLACDSGTFTVSGTDASLQQGYHLSAESGTFAVSGTDASLEQGYVLSAESGTFAVTGTAAFFNLTRFGEPGVYTITGTAASLEWHRVLTAESGTYTITGADATLNYSGSGASLEVDSGAFTVTGADASLLHGRTLGAQAGSVTVTGVATSLEYGRLLSAVGGSFAVTGAAATLSTGSGVELSPTQIIAALPRATVLASKR